VRLAALLLLCTPLLAAGQAASPALPERGALEAEASAARARSDAVLRVLEATPRPPRPALLPPPAATRPLAPGAAPDPAALAARYAAPVQADEAAGTLLVFVSTSMPAESLLRLARQARDAQATLVFRGLAGASLREMVGRLQPLAATGATLQIDPRAFTHHAIEVVPTVVLAVPDPACRETPCEAHAARVAGDVTLDYALAHLARTPGPAAAVAEARLVRLRRHP
jgi:conjugal transfer pilus assembly protein TrbC